MVHEIARHWWAITGDSYIVHGVAVVSASGAGAYIGKYLLKGYQSGEVEGETGLSRRWSTSRGWPGNDKLRLAQTSRGGWAVKRFSPGHVDAGRLGGPDWLLEREGTDIALASKKQREARKLIKQLGVKI